MIGGDLDRVVLVRVPLKIRAWPLSAVPFLVPSRLDPVVFKPLVQTLLGGIDGAAKRQMSIWCTSAGKKSSVDA
jgi:hypothetical protein